MEEGAVDQKSQKVTMSRLMRRETWGPRTGTRFSQDEERTGLGLNR